MRLSAVLSFFALAAELVSAGRSGRSLRHVGKKDKVMPRLEARASTTYSPPGASNFKFLTEKTKKYAVNGKKIPDVDFDVGESYAGLMPISTKKNEERQLYFWFFPSVQPGKDKEILIWLNGGPGCSSLEGFLQENGPFLWQYGTFKPVPNPYKWNNLTNVVWVEQPVGTGFSQGTPTATSEKDVAEQFLGFFKNFVTTFAMEGYKVFIAGESYAGYYVPYIADAMLNKKDKAHFDLEATLIYDPSVSTDQIQEQIPAVQFVDYWKPLFSFNDSFTDYLHNASDACGYTAYLDKYVTFPPSGLQPSHSPGTDKEGKVLDGCDVFNDIFNAVLLTNPCFDIYQVATTCPLLWDVMGFPGSFDYLPEGAPIYFNRTDVKKAINAPVHTTWMECTNKHVFVKDNDLSPPSGAYNGVLPGVIERSKRTIIAHAALDMVLILNGTMLMIQNLTWGGKMGFQKKPTEPFYVPYHDDPSLSTIAASGIMGTTHTERKLTWVTVDLAGHMVPQYAPSAAYRQLEFLLGRVDSLSSTKPFTTQKEYPQSTWPLGNGNGPI